jgi:sugar lactone lactonase YvrE
LLFLGITLNRQGEQSYRSEHRHRPSKNPQTHSLPFADFAGLISARSVQLYDPDPFMGRPDSAAHDHDSHCFITNHREQSSEPTNRDRPRASAPEVRHDALLTQQTKASGGGSLRVTQKRTRAPGRRISTQGKQSFQR